MLKQLFRMHWISQTNIKSMASIKIRGCMEIKLKMHIVLLVMFQEHASKPKYLYCQAQPSPNSSFSWLAELALFSFPPATRPAAPE
jgi:hypothetical protein